MTSTESGSSESVFRARLRTSAFDKNERVLENLNLDFSTTASEEQFGEQEKPFCARGRKTEPTRNFPFIRKKWWSEWSWWAAESRLTGRRHKKRISKIGKHFHLPLVRDVSHHCYQLAQKKKLFVGAKKMLNCWPSMKIFDIGHD